MSIDVRGGGLVSVDTGSLRDAAHRYAVEHRELDEVCGMLRHEASRLAALVDPVGDGAPGRVELIAGHVDAVAAGAASLQRRLVELAEVYEVVELRAARLIADAAGDETAAARLRARLRALELAAPFAALSAAFAEQTRRATVVQTLAAPLTAAMPSDERLAFTGLITAVTPFTGVGRPSSWTPLRGAATPVAVRPVATRHAGSAPESLAAAVGRIPHGDGDARVRVERYAMPDGSRRFAVYVAGTRSMATAGGSDPWDMESNLQLYTGRRSASYDATRAALAAAGARPGDTAYVFGHSQGGMLAGRLATEGGYDTRLLVTVGSPTEAPVGDATLSVQLRHTDDPVAALALGGSEATVGAPGSLVVEGDSGPHPPGLDAHRIDGYVDTAAQLDASTDPRVAGVREALAELRSASAVEVTEFGAERTGR
jgi:hypothetical protein